MGMYDGDIDRASGLVKGVRITNKIDEILKQYPYIGDDIQKYQVELNRYIELQQEARNPLKGQLSTGMPHTYGVSDQTYEHVEKIIDLYQKEIDRYAAEINRLLDLKNKLDKAMAELTEEERRIIYLRYDRGMSMNKIPYILHWKCGRDKVYKIMGEAQDKIRKMIL